MAEAEEEDDRTPWTAPASRQCRSAPIPGPLPESLELVMGDQIYIAKEGLPPALRNRLVRLAAVQNPEFYRAQSMRLPTYEKPRIIHREQAAARPFVHHVVVRPTGLRSIEPPDSNVRVEFQRLYSALAGDSHRNQLICNDVLAALREDRSPLVLTERTDHLRELVRLLSPAVRHLITLQGGLRRKELQALTDRLASIPPAEGRVIVATGRYIGEGYDDPRLDTLFLTLPVSWRGTVAQYAGRLHRLRDGKREVRIYDYADLEVPMLSRMFDRPRIR